MKEFIYRYHNHYVDGNSTQKQRMILSENKHEAIEEIEEKGKSMSKFFKDMKCTPILEEVIEHKSKSRVDEKGNCVYCGAHSHSFQTGELCDGYANPYKKSLMEQVKEIKQDIAIREMNEVLEKQKEKYDN